MKLFIILLLIIILGFLVFVKKPMEQQEEEEFNKLPREKPVYIDPRTVYLNEPILYDEWPQAPCEISSSL
jgi:hypothetical protein